MLPELIIRFLPIAILLLLGFTILEKKKLLSFPYYLSLFVCIVIVFSIAALPEDFSIDKPRYVVLFQNGYLWGALGDYKDMGWMYYVVFCAKLFRGNVYCFFLLTAVVYTVSYYVFARRFFGKKSFYFIIMAMGCLGFMGYATNTIRAGFAIAFLLFGIVAEKNVWKVLWLFLSIVIHRSMIIPVGGFIITGLVDKKWVYYSIWFICLILAVINVNLGPVFESFGFVDSRVDSYLQSFEDQFSSYRRGFRWDFLLYSVAPIVISMYNVHKHNIQDKLYDRMTNTYIFANAIWLLVIRMAYTDRIAYLSWFLIPFITLYPVITHEDEFRNPNIMVVGIMSLFMVMNIVLLLI